MKKLQLILMLLITLSSFSQVGIGTTTPNGALDINSTTTGLVLPRVVLTATNVATPIVNPNGGVLVAGTTVYNTNTTGGTYGVTPGFYFWDGSKWISQFQRVFSNKYVQSADLTVNTNGTYNTIVGTNSSFVAPFTGTYQFIFKGYLGAKIINSGNDVVGFVEGNFRLTINGNNNEGYSHSESFKRGNGNGAGTSYYELFNEVTLIINVPLVSGATCTFSGSYNGVADDNITTPNPHVVGKIAGLGNKCNLTVTYIGQ
jgi:hypothetical protein